MIQCQRLKVNGLYITFITMIQIIDFYHITQLEALNSTTKYMQVSSLRIMNKSLHHNSPNKCWRVDLEGGRLFADELSRKVNQTDKNVQNQRERREVKYSYLPL